MSRRTARDDTVAAPLLADDGESTDGFWDSELFWDADELVGDENTDLLEQVLTERHDAAAAERTTRSYMGVAADADECAQLAHWAEHHACSRCRRRRSTGHDLTGLEHDECRRALRVAQLLTPGV